MAPPGAGALSVDEENESAPPNGAVASTCGGGPKRQRLLGFLDAVAELPFDPFQRFQRFQLLFIISSRSIARSRVALRAQRSMTGPTDAQLQCRRTWVRTAVAGRQGQRLPSGLRPPKVF